MLKQKHDRSEPTSPPWAPFPKQKLTGWVRWPVRATLLPFIYLDLTAQWLARQIIRPPYKQEGHCLKRGNCCHYILVAEPNNFLNKIFYFWATEIHGFYLRRSKPIEIDNDTFAVMGCRYLKRDGSCQHYRLRPVICRKWPLIRHFGRPHILKGCGFQAVFAKKVKN